jgi:hypothetical protein
MTNDCQGPQDPPGIGAMNPAMNGALANRRILAHLTRKCFTRLLPPDAVIISKAMRESADLEMQQAGAAPMKFEDWGQ